MPFICRGNVQILPAYLTGPLSPSALDKVRADLALGAHERWDAALVKFKVRDGRRDLYGKSPEEVTQILETDENRTDPNLCPFIIIDQDTETNASVWYCKRRAEKEDWNDDMGEEHHREEVERLPFLLRVRTTVTSTPILWANLDICNITIPEMDEAYRGDPSAPYKIYHHDIDWENQKPPIAYVCAFPGEYEISSAPEDVARWLPKPEFVIRLGEESARQLGLVQRWTVGWESPKDGEVAMSFAADRLAL